MVSEAAIMGVSYLVLNTRRGYLDDLEEVYGMAYTIPERKLRWINPYLY